MVEEEARKVLVRERGVGPDGLDRLARRLAAAVRPGDVVLLYGPLGAGKTTFVRRFMAGLGYEDTVRSPSFAIAHVYRGREERPDVHHLDLFRLDRIEPEDVFAVDDYRTAEAVTLIEWPEGIEGAQGPADWAVRFEHETLETRTVTISASPSASRMWGSP